jgi:MFS transporter, MCT family, solute carrier family 16 (monocarboxylic acid transporters), member 13
MKEAPYAWVVVWATFVSLAVIFGVAYSFAAFFDSFAAEFSAKRADVALVFGLTGLIYFAFGGLGGMLSDRFGARLICSLGMLCIGVGLLLTSFAQSLNAVYLFYSVGIGAGIALAYTPAIGNVQPWFTARRGLASGIASSGIGLGTLLVPLLAATLIASMEWRMALRVMSGAVIVVGLGSTLLLKRAQLGPRNASTPLPGLTLTQALKDKRFWWFYLFTFTAAPTMFIPFAHVSASARDIGISDANAVGLVGLIGIGSLVGRFAISALADRLGRTLTLTVMQVSMATTYLLWIASGGYPTLAVFALWFGLSYGGIVSLMPAICMDLFGARAVAGIIGTLYTGAAVGNLLGPVAAGAVFDRMGSYHPVLWFCVVLSLVSIFASTRVRN